MKLLKRLSPSLQSLLLLLGVGVLIIIFAPRERPFQYSFALGQPWPYELLTAPYQFAIPKPEKQLEAERDSVKHDVRLYYRYTRSIDSAKLAEWDQDAKLKGVSNRYNHFVRNRLEEIYSTGLLRDEDITLIREQSEREVNLVESGVETSSKQPVGLLYNFEDAYRYITNDLPTDIDPQRLSALSIENYLRSNLVPDDSLYNRMVREAQQQIATNEGMVVAGERIIDKGEIVTPATYAKLEGLKLEYEQRTGVDSMQLGRLVGMLVLVLGILMMLWLYWYNYRRIFFEPIRNSLFVAVLIAFFVILTELAVSLSLFSAYVIPYLVLPILVRTFFDARTSFFVHLVSILLAALFVPYPLEFIAIELLAGLVTIFSLRQLTNRGQLVRVIFLAFLTYIVIAYALALMQRGHLEQGDLDYLLYFGINFILMMITYILVYPVERLFGFVSNIRLVELSDINRPLLHQLGENAPGTFQHSMQVSLLATEAAGAVGADVQLTRTGTLYHDIGKMLNPSYFTENQGIRNPHDDLPYEESAAIIIKHVTEGVALAQKNKLPEAIIDFIRTHHGRGVTKYFYTKYCNEHTGEAVDPIPFTYPGPNPFTKETGILMLADAVEAASRSLEEYSVESITVLVNRIVDSITADHMLDNTPLTFRDITTIKQVFVDKLQTIYHSRVAYPTLKNQPNETP